MKIGEMRFSGKREFKKYTYLHGCSDEGTRLLFKSIPHESNL